MSENPTPKTTNSANEAQSRFSDVFTRLKSEVHKVFVGQDKLVTDVLSVLFADGHVLLEGVPGLGKTLLIHTLASALKLDFSRIQFTPDLMPADVVGTMVLREVEGGGHELAFQPGPIHASFVLADEINRATPKTQSALLEAMQERQVSVARQTFKLTEPFIVLATQNPVEQDGTYPLPEAQLDRFMVKCLVDYPEEHEYIEILSRTTKSEMPTVEPVTDGEDIIELRKIVRTVPISEQVERYAIRLVMATQPGSSHAPEIVNRCIELGAGPRGVQALVLMGKVRALIDGRFAVSCQDIRDVAIGVLRHRLILNFEARADRITPDELLTKVLGSVKELS